MCIGRIKCFLDVPGTGLTGFPTHALFSAVAASCTYDSFVYLSWAHEAEEEQMHVAGNKVKGTQ
jgi:hypothetical protein